MDDLRLAVERLHAVRLAGDRPLAGRLGLWPAPDPFEHPQPAVWSLLRSAEVGEETFHATGESRLIPTDGWRLGTDPDWRHTLEDAQRAGVRHVWFTLQGLEATHDALCGRPGAFAAIMAGLKRCAAVGLDAARHLADNDAYPFFDQLGDLCIGRGAARRHNVSALSKSLFGLLRTLEISVRLRPSRTTLLRAATKLSLITSIDPPARALLLSAAPLQCTSASPRCGVDEVVS